MDVEDFKRIIARERAARKAAERTMEFKSAELFEANQQLMELNTQLVRRSQDSEALYRRLIESITDVIYTLDADGHFLFMNNSGLHLLGKPWEQIEGVHFLELIQEDSRQEVAAFYSDQVANNMTNSYLEIPVVDDKGRVRWIGQNVQLIKDGDELDQVYVVARDITEEYALKNLLTQSEEKYRGMIENMQLGLMEVNVDGRIIGANESFLKLCGYTLDEIVGKNAKDLFISSEEEFEQMESKEALRKEGVTDHYEIKFKRKDGEIRWVVISGAPIIDDSGNVTGSVGIHFDITHRKLIEKELKDARRSAEQAQKAEKEFLARMSHEIRTPLNVILGMSHLMFDSALRNDQLEYMRSIHYSAQLLKGLVSDVLDYNTIEAGEVELTPSTFNIHQLFESFYQMFSYNLKERNIDFTLKIDPTVPKMIKADQVLINQVLLNLIGNAVKFTDEGYVSLEVQQEDETLLIEISDTGIGIETSDLSTVFDRFQRSDDPDARTREGSGLGLNIVRKLVDILDGDISVSSEKGSGTRFFIDVPYEVAEETADVAGSGLRSNLIGLTALIAEDNPMNMVFLSNLLIREGAEVKKAEDGQEALNMSHEGKVDVIFMDVQMPKMTGLEVTQEIRSDPNNPNTRTRIVGLSAFAFKGDIEASLKVGMNEYITKPFAPSAIYELLGLEKESLRATSQHDEENMDQSIMEELYGGDRSHEMQMFGLFLANMPRYLEELRELATQSDVDSCASIIHKIYPSFRMVGFPKQSERWRSLEKNLKSSELSDKLFVEIHREINRSQGKLAIVKQTLSDAEPN